MTSSRNHQEAHGIGQIEEQLKQQGGNEADREITKAANRDEHTSLDEIVGN